MKTKKLVLAALVSWPLAACAAGEAAEGGKLADTTHVTTLSPSDVAVANRENIAEAVVITGTLNPYRIVEVRAQVPGVLRSLTVDRGSAVREGQPLARIEAEGIRGQAAGAAAGVAAAQAQLALTRRQLDSAKRLHDAGAISDIEFEQARAAHEAAEAQVAAATAQATAAGESARRATVAAPIAGEISDRTASEGEAVNVGQSLLTIVDSRTLELAGQVPVNQAVRLRTGMPVEFTVDAFPERILTGKIARVEPAADPNTRNIGVYVQVPNGDRTLVGGLFATGRIRTGTTTESVVVPSGAVRDEGETRYVWMIEGEKVVRRTVVPGARDEARGVTQITTGLEGGEQVIVVPGEVEEGMAVRVAAPAPVKDQK